MDVPRISPSLVDDLFADAAQLYIGVVSGDSPHVTPELLATGDGQLWCLTAAVTRKVAVLTDDERVGFYAATPAGDVVGIGRASVLNPLEPSNLGHPLDVARAAIGTARFAARNAAELSGAVVDTLTGKLGRPLPPHRVVVSIEPIALAALRHGELDAWGDWSTGAPLSGGDVPAPSDVDDADAPDDLRDLLDDGPAALGWFTAGGHPLVLPAAWRRGDATARVPSRLFVQCGAADRSAAAVTRDKWTGYGPTGKQGVMLRGEGSARATAEGVDAVVEVDRLTYWDGVETHSTSTA